MVYLTVQTILLIAIAFVLGAIVGCLLRRWFSAEAAADTEGSKSGQAKYPRTGAEHASVAPTALAEPAKAEPAAVPVVPQPVPVPVPPLPEVVEQPEELTPPPPPSSEAAAVEEKPKEPKREPVGKAEPVPAPDGGEKDNLRLIRGIGPQNESRLNAIGVERFSQIAAWTKKDQREIGERLSFPGRIEREDWVRQAKQLAKGQGGAAPTRGGKERVKTSTTAIVPDKAGVKPPVIAQPRGGDADHLTAITGVGSAIERKLFKLGIFHIEQIAAWNEDEGVWIGNEIGFPGRVAREDWPGKAKALAQSSTIVGKAPTKRGQIKTRRKSDN